LHPSFADMC